MPKMFLILNCREIEEDDDKEIGIWMYILVTQTCINILKIFTFIGLVYGNTLNSSRRYIGLFHFDS